jgi:hypothetical protein
VPGDSRLTTANRVANMATYPNWLPTLTLIAKALDAVTPNLVDVAEWCKVSHHSIRAYRNGDRRPTPETVTRFVAAIRRHAKELTKLADQLEKENR